MIGSLVGWLVSLRDALWLVRGTITQHLSNFPGMRLLPGQLTTPMSNPSSFTRSLPPVSRTWPSDLSKMGWFSVSVTAGVVLLTTIGYFFNTAYTHRRKFKELRKQGVVSFFILPSVATSLQSADATDSPCHKDGAG